MELIEHYPSSPDAIPIRLQQPDSSHSPHLHLARRQLAGINNLVGFLEERLLSGPTEWRSGQGHQTGTCGLEDTERRNELEEGVDP